MEPIAAKESIVARLFGFGRRKRAAEEARAAEAASAEAGFGRTDAEIEDPRITVPEQVIRVRTGFLKGKDETVAAIGDSFRELTTLLSNIGERLERQDGRAADLTDQLKDLPEYLRALPRLQEEQNRTLASLGARLAEGNEVSRRAAEEHVEAVRSVAEKVSVNADAIREAAGAIARLPDELKERAAEQEAAIRKVAAAQHQTARVLHASHNKSLQLFHQATQKSLQSVQSVTREQQRQMQELLDASLANMKRMFVLAGAFLIAAFAALAGLLWLR